jgi:hypothetical protein
MFHPMTPGSLIASHDAWLAEMNKEPSAELGQVVRPEGQRGRLRGMASRLIQLAHRLRRRQWPEIPVVPEPPAQVPGPSG